MNNARVVVTKQCDRSCPDCCNQHWDLDNLPIITRYDYDMILLTGGEPLKFIEELRLLVRYFRAKTKSKIVCYTAKLDSAADIAKILAVLDGITITVRSQEDVDSFVLIDKRIADMTKTRDCRLYIFGDLNIPDLEGKWKLKMKTWWKYKRLEPQETLLRTPKWLGG